MQYLPLPKYELLKRGISKEFIPYINERNRVGKTLIEENRELTYSPEGKSKKQKCQVRARQFYEILKAAEEKNRGFQKLGLANGQEVEMPNFLTGEDIGISIDE